MGHGGVWGGRRGPRGVRRCPEMSGGVRELMALVEGGIATYRYRGTRRGTVGHGGVRRVRRGAEGAKGHGGVPGGAVGVITFPTKATSETGYMQDGRIHIYKFPLTVL